MKITGTINYEIELLEGSYRFKFDRCLENELAHTIMTRDLLNYNKENLQSKIPQHKGKELNMIKDRLQKVTISEHTLGLIIDSAIGEFKPEVEEKPEVNNEPAG